MQKTTIVIHKDTVRGGESVDRWVCMRGHPHVTQVGATNCETAVAEGKTDAQLLVLFNAEVATFSVPRTISRT